MGQDQVTLEEFNKVKAELEGLKRQVSDLNSLKEELEFLKDIDEAWEEYDRGEFIKVKRDELSRELKKW